MPLVTWEYPYFYCGLCNFVSKDKDIISDHIYTHKEVSQNPNFQIWRCRICHEQQTFHLKEEFLQHQQEHKASQKGSAITDNSNQRGSDFLSAEKGIHMHINERSVLLDKIIDLKSVEMNPVAACQPADKHFIQHKKFNINHHKKGSSFSNLKDEQLRELKKDYKQKLKEIEQIEAERFASKAYCWICKEKESNFVIYECKHLYLCSSCGIKQTKCPYCNQEYCLDKAIIIPK